MTVDERIGLNIHELLYAQRKQQQALYVPLGITRFTLAKKLRGQIAWSASDIATAAGILGVDPGRLFSVAGAGFEPATSGLRASQHQLAQIIPIQRTGSNLGAAA